MTISISGIIMCLAVVSLLMATVGVQDFRLWRWFPGGMLLWAIGTFVSVNVH